MIVFERVRKAFGDQVVLGGVDLEVAPGEIVFIVGKSGAGKSVLMKHLVGLIRPDAGRILFEGQDITAWRERDFYPLRLRCPMVFQHSTLFDAMTVIDNVALPLRKHRRLSVRAARAEARGLLDQVQMADFAERYPGEIGAGLQKRVAIARALALSPAYVIFDEPTTGLDPLSAEAVDELIRHLSDALDVTCLVVSHDLTSIFNVADRVVMLYEGQVRLDGPPAAFTESEDPVIHQFINGLAKGPMAL